MIANFFPKAIFICRIFAFLVCRCTFLLISLSLSQPVFVFFHRLACQLNLHLLITWPIDLTTFSSSSLLDVFSYFFFCKQSCLYFFGPWLGRAFFFTPCPDSVSFPVILNPHTKLYSMQTRRKNARKNGRHNWISKSHAEIQFFVTQCTRTFDCCPYHSLRLDTLQFRLLNELKFFFLASGLCRIFYFSSSFLLDKIHGLDQLSLSLSLSLLVLIFVSFIFLRIFYLPFFLSQVAV